jgi:hypothetical protein
MPLLTPDEVARSSAFPARRYWRRNNSLHHHRCDAFVAGFFSRSRVTPHGTMPLWNTGALNLRFVHGPAAVIGFGLSSFRMVTPSVAISLEYERWQLRPRALASIVCSKDKLALVKALPHRGLDLVLVHASVGKRSILPICLKREPCHFPRRSEPPPRPSPARTRASPSRRQRSDRLDRRSSLQNPWRCSPLGEIGTLRNP